MSKHSFLMLVASSRRDDIISMMYILIYLLNKTLPWLRVKDSDFKQRFKRVLLCKEGTNPAKIARGESSNH